MRCNGQYDISCRAMEKPGQAAYGFRQAAMWLSLAARAERQFSKIDKEYMQLIK